MRLPTRAYAKQKSAVLPRKRGGAAQAVRLPIARSVRPRKLVSARKKSVASTTKKLNAKPGKSRRSASGKKKAEARRHDLRWKLMKTRRPPDHGAVAPPDRLQRDPLHAEAARNSGAV